jgi:hypothetical protein
MDTSPWGAARTGLHEKAIQDSVSNLAEKNSIHHEVPNNL